MYRTKIVKQIWSNIQIKYKNYKYPPPLHTQYTVLKIIFGHKYAKTGFLPKSRPSLFPRVPLSSFIQHLRRGEAPSFLPAWSYPTPPIPRQRQHRYYYEYEYHFLLYYVHPTMYEYSTASQWKKALKVIGKEPFFSDGGGGGPRALRSAIAYSECLKKILVVYFYFVTTTVCSSGDDCMILF